MRPISPNSFNGILVNLSHVIVLNFVGFFFLGRFLSVGLFVCLFQRRSIKMIIYMKSSSNNKFSFTFLFFSSLSFLSVSIFKFMRPFFVVVVVAGIPSTSLGWILSEFIFLYVLIYRYYWMCALALKTRTKTHAFHIFTSIVGYANCLFYQFNWSLSFHFICLILFVLTWSILLLLLLLLLFGVNT